MAMFCIEVVVEIEVMVKDSSSDELESEVFVVEEEERFIGGILCEEDDWTVRGGIGLSCLCRLLDRFARVR